MTPIEEVTMVWLFVGIALVVLLLPAFVMDRRRKGLRVTGRSGDVERQRGTAEGEAMLRRNQQGPHPLP